MKKYCNTVEKIKADERFINNTEQRLIAEKNKSKRKFSIPKLAGVAVALVFVAFLGIMIDFITGEHFAPPIQRETHLHDNYTVGTNTITFNSITLETTLEADSSTYDGYYLVISGVFDCADFALATDSSSLILYNKESNTERALPLDTALTAAFSLADLHINTGKGETKGTVSLVYELNSTTYEYIQRHRSDTSGAFYDLTLCLTDCFIENSTQQMPFIFLFNQIT